VIFDERRVRRYSVTPPSFVFTLAHQLSALIAQNKRLLYDLLRRTSAASLLELARDPGHLGADIGCPGVLPSWGQNLLHCTIEPVVASCTSSA
jgi:hypothetical protein